MTFTKEIISVIICGTVALTIFTQITPSRLPVRIVTCLIAQNIKIKVCDLHDIINRKILVVLTLHISRHNIKVFLLTAGEIGKLGN